MNWSLLFGLLGAVVSIIAILAVVFSAGKISQQLDRLNQIHPVTGCVGAELASEVKVLSSKMDVFWSSFSTQAADLLRQHSQPERDLLVDKLVNNHINFEECQKLYTLLRNDLVENGPDTLCAGPEAAGKNITCVGRKTNIAWLMAFTESRMAEFRVRLQLKDNRAILGAK